MQAGRRGGMELWLWTWRSGDALQALGYWSSVGLEVRCRHTWRHEDRELWRHAAGVRGLWRCAAGVQTWGTGNAR